ncbi:MAG: tRNA dimethylallyltransferase [Chlamydiae bacterium]|nr:tRNA dimethylallyltransferase [Chlamydiota bacterium]
MGTEATSDTVLGGIRPLEAKLFNSLKTKSKKVILLAGPTACGKSEFSIEIAKAVGGEIVSADSMQVYRGMDIGTAKVSQGDQARVPHHLIDIRHLQESFNVVDFYYEARRACDSILARDRVPIIVGGSGFYFRTLLYGPPLGPPSIPEMREAIEEEMHRLGAERMYDKLKELDPDYAATITKNDRQKIIRALEIVTLTGDKVSNHQWKREQIIPDYKFYCWFLYRPRKLLYTRIDERCERMLDSGLLDEVRTLEKQGLRTNPSASQAIGYRQCLEYLDTPQTGEDYKQFVQDFKTASRHYAKRQFTWFRKESLFRWLNIEVHDFEISADLIIQDFLSS